MAVVHAGGIRLALTDAASRADLHALYKTWCSAQVSDAEMEALEVCTTVGELMCWADEARSVLLAQLGPAPDAMPVSVNARKIVRAQARWLDFLCEIAGWAVLHTEEGE